MRLKRIGLKIYEPDAQIKKGWFYLWQEMAQELFSSRQLIWRLFLRDFLAKYKQAVLGILWAIIMPIMMVGIFVFLNRAGILNIGETNVPYPVFALLGISIWQLFATGLTAASNSVIGAGGMVVKINFAKEALVLASFAQAVFEFLVRLVLIAAVFMFYKTTPCWQAIFFPFILIPIILLTLGLGFIFSLLSAIMRDIPNIVSLLTTFLLFATPVLYPVPASGLFAGLARWNPLAILVSQARDIVITGHFSQPQQYLLACIFSVIIFILCWRVFHLVEPRIAERV